MLNSVSLPVINGLRLLCYDCYDKENVRTVGLTKAIDIIRPRYYYSSDTVSIMFSERTLISAAVLCKNILFCCLPFRITAIV